MKEEISMTVGSLRAMTLAELQQRYAEVFGEATRCRHKDHLLKRIVWRMQALREGGLSQRARARAAELANEADLRLRAPGPPRARQTGQVGGGTRSASEPRHPTGGPPAGRDGDPGAKGVYVKEFAFAGREQVVLTPGTILRREYKGRVIVVRVLDSGFEHDGERYRSLTAVAQKVTGSHWNGMSFFGVTAPRGRKGNP
jgi:hypothetical protein